MKKIFWNKYFLTIVIVCIAVYAIYFLTKNKNKSNNQTYANYFDELNTTIDNNLVDQAFCDSPAMQALDNNYIDACNYAIGNCNKLDLISEFENFSQAISSGSNYQCNQCCYISSRTTSNISDQRFGINNNVS